MADLWNKLGKVQKRLIILAGFITLFGTGGALSISKGLIWVKDKVYNITSFEIDSIKKENTMLWAELQYRKELWDSVTIEIEKHRDISYAIRFSAWHWMRATSEKINNEEYYTVFDDDGQRDVDLRKSLETGDIFAFMDDGSYLFFPAHWSRTDEKYVIIPPHFANDGFKIFKK